jgi:tetratricopeptide (TPR) repeat protein
VTALAWLAAALAAGAAALFAIPAAAQGGGELARLEARAKAFYEQIERGDRERAAQAFPGLAADLAAFHANLRARLDQMRDDVMEREGDIEALYKSPRWREPEIQSLVATYHLAWVRYQGAQLTRDAAQKKKLLQQAAEGFSQFLIVNEVPEIYAESLYGRGLAFLDMGESAKAIEDLSQAAEEPRVAGKAKAALAEARRRAAGGKAQTPSENDPEALIARLGDLLPRAAAGDAAAEKDATALARGLAIRGGTWPTRVASLVTDKLGGANARSSYGLYLLGQLAVDRQRCAEVAPLADAGASMQDEGRARYRPELLFLDAGCRLNSGQAREAAARFAALSTEFPKSPRAREAAYYRFRALDVARASAPSLAGEYEQALSSYLATYPQADGAGEARFLLAELHRAAGDCAKAAGEYAAVGSGAFAQRARFGALQCRVSGLGSQASPAARTEVLGAIRAFVNETQDKSLGARAAVLGAAVAASGTAPDHAVVLALLDGFETRYPDAKDLHSSALELRLGARVASGQTDGAEKDLDAFLALPPDADRRRTLARVARDLATRAERAGPAEGGTALALARKAHRALVERDGSTGDRITLAQLELRAGDAASARRLFEEVLKSDPASAEALRGAARASAAAGDRENALAYWRTVLDASPTGGTAWYEARVAQVTLLAEDGRRAQACEILRSSRGRATSAGGDTLEARLRELEPTVCR